MKTRYLVLVFCAGIVLGYAVRSLSASDRPHVAEGRTQALADWKLRTCSLRLRSCAVARDNFERASQCANEKRDGLAWKAMAESCIGKKLEPRK